MHRNRAGVRCAGCCDGKQFSCTYARWTYDHILVKPVKTKWQQKIGPIEWHIKFIYISRPFQNCIVFCRLTSCIPISIQHIALTISKLIHSIYILDIYCFAMKYTCTIIIYIYFVTEISKEQSVIAIIVCLHMKDNWKIVQFVHIHI